MTPELSILKTYICGQAKLGYATFDPGPDPSDIILAAFPKSGSTWTSYLLHILRSHGEDDFSDIKKEVIDITPGHWFPDVNPFLVHQRFWPRTFKTHGSYGWAPKGGKYIYIARDPYDSYLSHYHFLHDLFALQEKIDHATFFKDCFVERFDSGHDIANPWEHFKSWFPHKDDSNVLWLHYEDLHENRAFCLRAIAAHMEIDLNDELLDLVLKRSQISHTRTLADKLNSSITNMTGRVTLSFGEHMDRYASNMKFGKMRRGKRGEGKEALPDQIIEKLDTEWSQRIIPSLGFRDYGQMRAECSILKINT